MEAPYRFVLNLQITCFQNVNNVSLRQKISKCEHTHVPWHLGAQASTQAYALLVHYTNLFM